MAKTLVSNMTDTTPTHDEIAAHAYQIYLREGCIEGRDVENWLRAESELRARATNGNGNGHATVALTTERTITPAASAPTRSAKSEPVATNSVVPPASPIAQVTRSTAPKKNSGKREASAAAK